MDTTQTVFAIIAGVILVLGALAGVIAFFKKSLGDAAISRYEQVHEADVERIKQLEDGQIRLEAELEALRRENLVLRDLTTGQSAIIALGEQVSANHRTTVDAMAGVTAALKALKDNVTVETRQIKGLLGDERFPPRSTT